MFMTGVGIGPSLSVFTIIVQNAVPFQKLGVATSNLTFFRQIGGSVGLAIAGTVFANALVDCRRTWRRIVDQIATASPPRGGRPDRAGFAQNAASLDLNNLTGVGQTSAAAHRGRPAGGAPAVVPSTPSTGVLRRVHATA